MQVTVPSVNLVNIRLPLGNTGSRGSGSAKDVQEVHDVHRAGLLRRRSL